MSALDPVADAIRAWLAKADDDLRTAELVLAAGADGPPDTAAYHAQQCVEKHLKALLVSRGLNHPHTHDVSILITLLSEAGMEPPPLSVEEQVSLTAYATATRYPGDYEAVSHEEARLAFNLARRVRDHVRSALQMSV